MSFVHFGNGCTALEELEQRGARAASALAAAGVAPGGVVAILMRNTPAFVEALTCIRCLGATRVLIPWHLAPAEICRVLAAVAPDLLIGHSDLLVPLASTLAEWPQLSLAIIETHADLISAYGLNERRQPPTLQKAFAWDQLIAEAVRALPIPAGAPQAISLSSGSTGMPKVIRWEGPQPWESWYRGRTTDRPPIVTSIVTAPLYHGAQYGVFSQAWRLRANQVILPKFDAEAFLAAVERHRVNHAYLVPTMFLRLLRLPAAIRNRYDLSSLNYVFHSGAPCPPDIKRQMLKWLGPILWEAYGCSETSTIAVCRSEVWLRKPGTVGRPVRPVAILDDAAKPCRPRQAGHIYVDVTGLPAVKYDDRAVPGRCVEGCEMVPSGDIGWLDEEGYLFISSRADDLINTGRVKVYPAEIEEAILRHPAVLDCCVFAVPDPEFGQVIAAVLEVAEGHLGVETEIRAFLAAQISEHKIPVHLWTRPHSIRTESGKLNRSAVAHQFRATQSVPV